MQSSSLYQSELLTLLGTLFSFFLTCKPSRVIRLYPKICDNTDPSMVTFRNGVPAAASAGGCRKAEVF